AREQLTDPTDREDTQWGYDFRPPPTPAQIKRAERRQWRALNTPSRSHDHGPSRGHGMGL
ncbi:hypothetical protein, partial [Nocardia grenadensis]